MASATINDQLALYMTVAPGDGVVSALITRECYVETVFATGTSSVEQSALTIERVRTGSPTVDIVQFGLIQFAIVSFGVVDVLNAKLISTIGCPLLPGDLVRVTLDSPGSSGDLLFLLSAPGATIPASSV